MTTTEKNKEYTVTKNKRLVETFSFLTKKMCEEFIAENLESHDIYYLKQGEYSPPVYRPRKYKHGWGIHREVFYYSSTLTSPKSCRVNYEDLTPELCRIIRQQTRKKILNINARGETTCTLLIR